MSLSRLQVDPHPTPEALAALDALCFRPGWSPEVYAVLLRGGNVKAWLLRGQDTHPLGLLCVLFAAGEAELLRIGIAPCWTGKGVGRWLLDWLVEEARRQGWRALHLEVRAGNAPARRLYERADFVETGRRVGYYQTPWEDAVLYRLDVGGVPADTA